MKLIKNVIRTTFHLLSNKLVKWVVVPCILLILWFVFSLLHKNFTVLQYSHNNGENNSTFDRKLLKGEKSTGTFTAQENNLGIVELKFGDVPSVDFAEEDSLAFRIKEKSQKVWQYENTYKSGSISSNEYFPFGFVSINNSKGKTYVFEIESLNGNKINALETKSVNSIYFSKYKFSRSEILSNPKSIIVFMYKKTIIFFTNFDSLVSSWIFLFPFALYLMCITVVDKKILRTKDLSRLRTELTSLKFSGKSLFTAIVLTLMLAYIFFSESLMTGIMLLLFSLWIFVVYKNRFKSRVTFILAFTIILISVLGFYFGLIINTDNASTFAYLLILIGFVQNMRERRGHSKVNR